MDTPGFHGPEPHDVAHKATQGIGWRTLSFGLGKGLSLVTISILAHLLSPDDFGVVALATVAISYLSVARDLGLGAALVQRRDQLEDANDTVFSLNLLLGVGLALVTVAIAPAVALAFREPAVAPILRWLALSFSFNALGSIHMVRLQRDLDFRRRMVPELGNALVKGLVSIALAVAGFGAWSLVYGQLAGALVSVVLVWRVLPWRPRLSVNVHLAGELFRYGFSVMTGDALAIAADNLDYLLIGVLFNETALGIYTLAYRLPELLVLHALWVIAGVMFPTFSSLQRHPKLLRATFLSTVRYIGILVTPICLGMFLVADPLIQVAFGSQWLNAIPILRVLAIDALILSIGFHVGDLYKAVGRPDILVKLSLLFLAVKLGALWTGSHFGLIGIALGHLTAGLIEAVVRLMVATRYVDISIGDVLSQLTAFKGGAALVAAAVPALLLTQNAEPLARLLLVSAIGATAYLSVMWVVDNNALRQAGRIVGIISANEAR